MNKRRLQIAERESGGRGMPANFSTNMSSGDCTRRMDMHVMVHRGAERGDIGKGVVTEVLDMRDKA